MTNNNAQVTEITVNEKGVDNGQRMAEMESPVNRSFGVTTLWNIRKNARTFKIHNRMPRL